MFKNEALRFYYASLKYVQYWDRLLRILRQRYAGTTRMKSIEDEVSLMNINNFLLESAHEAEALHKITRKIEDFVSRLLQAVIWKKTRSEFSISRFV